VVAPQVRTASGELDLTLRREPTLRRALGMNWTGLPALAEYVTDPAAYQCPQDVDWAVGAALLISRRCFDDLGGWDESFFLYSEETDFCLRARDRGFSVHYVPDSVVTHLAGASGRNRSTHAMQILNRVRLYRRRQSTLRAWIYWALTICSEASWALRGQSVSWFAVRALLQPSVRPATLGCSQHLLPT
jgi:GT2 family glycosyltransferase